MLFSEIQERERRFKLALRAGIPIVLLVSLVLYSILFKHQTFELTIETGSLLCALLFITVYFIYFLMELSVKETLIDQTTLGFNEKAFIHKLNEYRPKTLVLLIIKNLSTINENYSSKSVDLLLYNIIQELNNELSLNGLEKALIARRHGAEFLIALNRNRDDIQSIFEHFIQNHSTIDEIELDYSFAVIKNTNKALDKTIPHLKDLIETQSKSAMPDASLIIEDAQELSRAEAEIVQAIKDKNLQLSFRPLLNIQNNIIDIYEISVKLKSPTKGTILPKHYLPIINRLGLGREYDMALVKHILSILPLTHNKISFSFNLSPFSLRDIKFQETFFTLLNESNINSSQLIIELYERKTHHNLSGYLKTLNKFRAKGVRIAIDNFGSSNASMEYMKHFKFDLVQFDRDYVTKLEDNNTQAMLNSLVNMSKELKILTVAKWVDNETQKKKLVTIGLDYMQGFGIAKPINEKELLDTYN